MTFSPRSAAIRLASSQTSSGIRMVRFGVAGWLGTPATLGPGVFAPAQATNPIPVVSTAARTDSGWISVYTIVVSGFEWPSSSCTARRSLVAA